MKKLIFALIIAIAPAFASAAGGDYPLDTAPVDLANKTSLQRGAKLFANYCMGCHSAAYQRYNRFAKDSGLSDKQVLENLVFTGAKVGDTMDNAMPDDMGKQWFGVAPPDLSLIARSRGSDWLYTYLRTFYLDDTRIWGVNNAVFPAVGMPHVLWELQGWQKPVYKTEKDSNDKEVHTIDGFEIVKEGSMSPREFDSAMGDLVNFLTYVAEPVRLERQRLGVWVLLFIILMTAVFYLLKKEYWKDVH